MKFNRVFRGYAPQEVDDYIAEREKKENEIRAGQKQRINELSDENAALRVQIAEQQNKIEQYQRDEKAISRSLVESQKLASQLQNDAEKLSALTLTRAKIFYATWYAYSQTLVATLSDEEVVKFNELLRKMENIINAYDGGDVRSLAREAAEKVKNADEPTKVAATTVNPIEKVEQAAGVIDLQELLVPKESLADLCRELGVKPEDK